MATADADPVLEEGMVLSVDFPVFDQGAGGTAHLEDLSLITATGAQLLNSPTERTISV
jgi:Xaa-Pro aminopeptidase